MCKLIMCSLAVVGNLVPRQGVESSKVKKNACRTRIESLSILLSYFYCRNSFAGW